MTAPELRLGVGLIVEDGLGRILLHRRRGQDAWAPPSGHVEGGECLPQAAQRELFEETGLDLPFVAPVAICDDPKYQVVEYHPGQPVHFVTALFVGMAPQVQLSPGAEGSAWGWFARDELPEPRLAYTDHWLATIAAGGRSPVLLPCRRSAAAEPGIRPRIGVLAVVSEGGEVLLAMRRNEPQAGEWGFPGGHLEPGERLGDAAVRELREETGIAARSERVAALVELRPTPGCHYLLAAVECSYLAGTAKAGDDVDVVRWFRANTLPSPLSDNVSTVARLTFPGG